MPTPSEAAARPSDGIADLQARRQRRTPLPPRHPRTTAQQSVVEPASDDTAVIDVRDDQADASATEQSAPTPAPSTRSDPPAPRRPPRAKASEEAEAPLRLAQFYVAPSHDDALRRIRATGLIDNMDVSGSAVVRYALDQLLAKHKPDELVRLLGCPKGQKQGQRGRPRR